MTKILPATSDAIREAADILRRGGLVAFPTETVYGLGADTENDAAVRALFAAKGRPPDHPVIVHLADASLLEQFAATVPPVAHQLAAAFWPGPLTLVLRRSGRVTDLVTGGLETVGLRVPAHPVAQALLREFGGAIAAPSANRFGRVSATLAEHVAEELTGHVDLILDGGECQVGLESTIIDLSGTAPAVLRPGGVTAQQLATVLATEISQPSAHSPRVSGGLPSHYAPQARVELLAAEAIMPRAKALAEQGHKVAAIAAGSERMADPHLVFLPLPSTAEALAHALYALLRKADELGCEYILITPPAEAGLGAAIADRLRRAAGPKGQ